MTKKVLSFLLPIFLFVSCSPEQEETTQTEITAEIEGSSEKIFVLDGDYYLVRGEVEDISEFCGYPEGTMFISKSFELHEALKGELVMEFHVEDLENFEDYPEYDKEDLISRTEILFSSDNPEKNEIYFSTLFYDVKVGQFSEDTYCLDVWTHIHKYKDFEYQGPIPMETYLDLLNENPSN